MFAKLLKAEFRAVQGGLAAVCASALIAGLAGGLALRYLVDADRGIIFEHWVLNLIFGVVEAGALMAMAACGVAAVILLLSRFYHSRFTDEGYLTFTLPVSTHEILLSSLVSSLLCLMLVAVVIAVAFVIFCLAGVCGDPDFWEWLREVPEALAESFQSLKVNAAVLLAEGIFFAVAACLWQITCLMLAISIGALLAKKHKVLAGAGAYYLIQMVVGTGQLLQFSDTYEAQRAAALLRAMLLWPGVLSLILAALAYFLTYLLVSRKLNLP